jgi:hypothetical protein
VWRRTLICTIALTACLAPASVRADLTSSVMIAFSQSGSDLPQFSIWDGSSWGSPADTSTVGANPYWVVLRNCPKRNETACATLDANEDVNVMFYNGSVWTAATEVCTITSQTDNRNFDMAYESRSGDLLLVYYDGATGEKNLGYVTYDGASLSSESDLALSSGSQVPYVTLHANPRRNEIMLLVVPNPSRLTAAAWNGSSWGSWATLNSNLETTAEECYALAYESISGEALVAYSPKNATSPEYQTWNGAVWSVGSGMPDLGDVAYWIRLVPDPSSDEILFAALDEGRDINVLVWNGSAWGSTLEVEANAQYYDRRQFDLAYENGGNEALLVYHENGQTSLRYRTWDGSSWSTEQIGPDIGHDAHTIQLRTGMLAGEVFIAVSDAGNDLELLRWDGSSLSASTQISTNHGGAADVEPFMVVMPAEAPPPWIINWREERSSAGGP